MTHRGGSRPNLKSNQNITSQSISPNVQAYGETNMWHVTCDVQIDNCILTAWSFIFPGMYIFTAVISVDVCLFNPFLPTGQFIAPKLIILIKCLIDILFFSVVLMFLYVEQDVNLA